MRCVVLVLSVAVSACSASSSPVAPAAPPQPQTIAGARTGSIWVLAIDATGNCIPATAEVIAGYGSGQTFSQELPCDEWDADGGFLWKDVPIDETMTIRLSAPFRVATERTLTPRTGGIMATVVELKPITPPSSGG